jgi:maltooligosyltrehalose trehalohydrolase
MDRNKSNPPAPRPQGADLLPEGGVRHRVWAPEMKTVEAVIYEEKGEGSRREVRLSPEGNGIFTAVDQEGRGGDRYKYRLDGDGIFPDPFSRWQPEDVFNPSMVIDPRAYRWQVDSWEKIPLCDSVIYELHVGTFTREGTFRSAIARLDHLVSLGVTTVELMPIAAFPGNRNWGYDGVMLFAPDKSYGHPDDLRALVDEAHKRGLNVLLDVVYNHFGPDGNFLAAYSPHYFTSEKKTPWGDAINFSGPGAQHVRAVFTANAAYWMDEFRIDGFRLDATHEILDDSTPHILAEIARVVQARGGLVVAEDDRNLAELSLPSASGGYGLDGLWADDFHHTVRVALLQQREAYFANFTGDPEELVSTLHHGWLYCGQVAPALGSHRGTPTGKLAIDQFIHCISNHDQVGNRAFGERLNHLVSSEAYRAASALICLTPSVPMLFMGQEWAASSPFLYFTDHHDELGALVTEGRRREFKEFFEAIHESRAVTAIPDPQDEKTFRQSKLDWNEPADPQHHPVVELYRTLLQLRQQNPDIRHRSRESVAVKLLGDGIVCIHFHHTRHSGLLVLVDLTGGHSCDLSTLQPELLPSGWIWKPFLSTNEKRFGGPLDSVAERSIESIAFTHPEVLLLQPENAS